MSGWIVVLGVVGLVLLTSALMALIAWRSRERLAQLARIVRPVLRLLRELMGDRTIPRRVRVAPALAVAYLAFPIDLVPDFIPVLGQLDDALVVAWALRRLVAGAGRDRVAAHWTGDQDDLELVLRLARVR